MTQSPSDSYSSSDINPNKLFPHTPDYKQTRRIRIFVSSTFTDMKEERETLGRFVFPEVRRYANKYGIDFDFVDLRWGITEEEVKEGKVIELCLRNIDNCRPLFLGILGAYNGWVPDKSELDKNPNLQNIFPWLSSMIGSKSMTELEIYYGTLRYQSHSLFMIRDDISEASESQQKLLSEITHSYPESCCRYANMDTFRQKVKQFILNFIESEFPLSEWTPRDQYFMENTLILNRLLSRYVARERFEKQINSFIENDHSNLLILSGGEGVGKKSMCAYVVGQCNEKEITCLYDFIGDGAKINLWQKQRYNDLVLSGEKAVIVLAYADFISKAEDENIVMDWLKNPQKNIKIVLSAYRPNLIVARIKSRSSIFPQLVKRPPSYRLNLEHIIRQSDRDFTELANGISMLNIDKFNDEEASMFIVKKLDRSGKSISKRLIEKILKNKVYRLPHHMDYLLTELIEYGNYETLEDFLDYFLENTKFDTRDTLNFIANKVFEGGEGKLNSHIELAIAFYDTVLGNRLCSRICEFLSHIVGYVKEDAVKYCLGLTHYDWARFENVFSRYLRFSNRGVCLDEYFYTSAVSPDRKDCNDKLLDYYDMLPPKFRNGLIDASLNSNDVNRWLRKFIAVPDNYYSSAQIPSLAEGWKILMDQENDPDIFHTLGFDRKLRDYEANGYMDKAFAMICDYFPNQRKLICSVALDICDKLTTDESIHLLYNLKKTMDIDICDGIRDILMIRFKSYNANCLILLYLHTTKLLFELLNKYTVENEELEEYIDLTNKILNQLNNYKGSSSLAIMDILITRGDFFSGLSKYDEAIKEYEKALFFATDSIDIVDIHLSLGTAKRKQHNIQEGIDELDLAVGYMGDIKSSAKKYGWNKTIADFYERIGEESAERYYLHNAYEAAITFYGSQSGEAINVCKKLAEVNQSLEDYETAASYYMRYLEYIQHKEDESTIYDVEMELVKCLSKIDRYSDVLKIYLQMPSDYRFEEINSSYDIFNFYFRIAFAAFNIHEYAIALSILNKILSGFDMDAVEVDTVKYLLMLCHMRAGDLVAAKVWALKMLKVVQRKREGGVTEDINEVIDQITQVLDTIRKCDNGDIEWEDTHYASRKVCKEWIEELNNGGRRYSYFRLNNYRSIYDSNGDKPDNTQFVILREPEIIAKQNDIIDSWKN